MNNTEHRLLGRSPVPGGAGCHSAAEPAQWVQAGTRAAGYGALRGSQSLLSPPPPNHQPFAPQLVFPQSLRGHFREMSSPAPQSILLAATKPQSELLRARGQKSLVGIRTWGGTSRQEGPCPAPHHAEPTGHTGLAAIASLALPCSPPGFWLLPGPAGWGAALGVTTPRVSPRVTPGRARGWGACRRSGNGFQLVPAE